MADICGIALTGGAEIASDVAVHWQGVALPAAVFPIDGQACGIAISSAPGDLADLVRKGRVAARADLDDAGVVTGLRLYVSGPVAATMWCAGLDPSFVPYDAQPWHDAYSFARVEAQLVGHAEPPRPAGAGEVQIELTGEITQQKANAIVSQIRSAAGRSLVLHIDSRGGFCEPMMALYDALKDHRHHVETRVIGNAMSAAAVIGMSGDLRTIVPSGQIMFHEASLTSADSMRAPTMRAIASKIDKTSQRMLRIVANRAGVPLTRAQAWLTAETRFDAAGAVRAGICHAVVADGPQVVAAGRGCGAVAKKFETSRRREVLSFTHHAEAATATAAAAWRQRMRNRFGFSQP